MQTNNILSASLIDIIFDGRNKAYGAYELRRTYERRIKKSLIVTFFVAGAAIGGTVMANSFKKNERASYTATAVNLQALPDEKEPEKIKEPEKPKPETAEQPVKTEKFTEFKPVEDDIITPPPSQDDLANSKIDLEKKAGIEDPGTIDKPGPDKPDGGTGIIDDKPVKTEEQILTVVEIDAKYDGNWKAFLESNLNANVPVDNGAPAGRYSVMIKFVVDKEGKLSDIIALTNHGYGMEDEAIRVIKKSKTWEPAIQNGSKVKAYRKQVIVFEVTEE